MKKTRLHEDQLKNEIRLSLKIKLGIYITEALEMFDNGFSSIILSGTDNAMFKVVLAAEIIKHRINNLH